jgi:glutathione S-transferase
MKENEATMKLYMYPLSTTSRPVRLFIQENSIPCDEEVIDLLIGEQHAPPFVRLNPNQRVPVLEDGELRLTESSTILKYLADKIRSPAYPSDLLQRARVNELMDWFNTNFYRDYGFGLVYPQLFPHHKRPSDEQQRGTIEWGVRGAMSWLAILDEHWLGAKKAYLTGDMLTIADYFGSSLVTLGELIRIDLSAFPNVERWLGNMKRLDSWARVHEPLYGFAHAQREQQFVNLPGSRLARAG